MNKKPTDVRDGWEAATFAGVERAQLRDGMRLSLGDKLAWLEQTQELVRAIAAIRPTPPPVPPRAS